MIGGTVSLIALSLAAALLDEPPVEDLGRDAAPMPGEMEPMPGELPWMSDYGEAYSLAREEQKLLLIYFVDEAMPNRDFEERTLADGKVQELCEDYVLLRLPTTAMIKVDGKFMSVIDHGAFRSLGGRQGLAVVDMKHRDEEFYGKTVSALPFRPPAYYASDYWGVKSVRILLSLPPGTITQRTLTYAVRCHPEAPASARGAPSRRLFRFCRRHSAHQAQIRTQGHHNWEARFHQVHAAVGGQPPVEVCAESWPGEDLLTACLDCVSSWRGSSGHWRHVRSRQPAFGYDIRRGSNGIWYATGIFGGRRRTGL